MHQCGDPKEIERTCYDFANEEGRTRATFSGGRTKSAESKYWFGVLGGTGERKITDYTKAGGVEARIIEIYRNNESNSLRNQNDHETKA